MIYRLDRELQSNGLKSVGEDDFPDADFRGLFDVIHKAIDQAQMDPKQFIQEKLPPSLVTLADEIRMPVDETDYQKLRHVEELHRAVIRLRRNTVNANLLQLKISTGRNPVWRGLEKSALSESGRPVHPNARQAGSGAREHAYPGSLKNHLWYINMTMRDKAIPGGKDKKTKKRSASSAKQGAKRAENRPH